MKLNRVNVSLTLPYFGKIEGTWDPDESEQKAAWEMYVELITRISVVELSPDEGLLREALSSLYTLFDTTRSILRKYGPTVAQPKKENNLSFGYLAVAILNAVIRPLLAKWHPLLLSYENKRPQDISIVEWERNWEYEQKLREEINAVRLTLIKYANILAKVAKVPPLYQPSLMDT